MYLLILFIYRYVLFVARDTDLRNTKKNGVLYLEDSLEKEWRPHFFVLSGNKLYYTDLCKTDIDNDDETEGGELDPNDITIANRLREVSNVCIIMRLVYKMS